ncbi:MAG: PBP1A family penicillin-binding protein [Acidobacteriota bacterium]
MEFDPLPDDPNAEKNKSSEPERSAGDDPRSPRQPERSTGTPPRGLSPLDPAVRETATRPARETASTTVRESTSTPVRESAPPPPPSKPDPTSRPTPTSLPATTLADHPDDDAGWWPSRHPRLVYGLLIPLFVGVLAMSAGVAVAAWIHQPEVATLEEFTPRLVTNLYDRDAEIFQTYSRENRVMLGENELPPLIKQAIIAAEDGNFYDHAGIDLQGIVRAGLTNLREGRAAEGASTLTMQLARELFLTREKRLKRKIEEAFLAVELEKQYSKEQILTLYANLVNFGHGNYGVEAAARDYFSKPAADLTVGEAATLAGIPQRPSDHPYNNPERGVIRRNYVLGRMLEEGFIDQATHDEARDAPLVLAPRRREVSIGSYFAEDVRRYLADTFGSGDLYDRGLQVHTTLDRQIQAAAEDALRDQLLWLDHRRGWRGALRTLEAEDLAAESLSSWSGLEEVEPDTWYEGLVLNVDTKTATVKVGDQTFPLDAKGIKWTRRSRPGDLLAVGDVAWVRLEEDNDGQRVLMLEQEPEVEGAAVVLESATGAIRAMVGGWSFERNEFNRVTQAQRQVGSSFKPFVFGSALEAGYSAADQIFDGPATFPGAGVEEGYSPRNYYRQYYGITTLRRALEQSVNVTAVKLLDMVGVDQVIDLAQRCGITSELPPYPSLALGAADITPLEMAAAYAAIVNHGIWVEPYLIERITSPAGTVKQEHLPRAQKAMEPEIAYILTEMLHGAVQNGTGRKVAKLDVAIGGKTGTTNDYTDAWFVGFTPKFTILTWVGYDKNRSLGRGMTGAEASLPAFRDIVERGLEEGWIVAGETFPEPPGVIWEEIEYASGLLPGPGSDKVVQEVFVEGTEPTQRYDRRWARIMRMPWYLQEPFYIPKEGEKMPGEIGDWELVRSSWNKRDDG